MEIIEVHIPDDLVSFLPLQKSNLENNIIDFLRFTYMNTNNELPVEQQYQQAAADNKQVMNEFAAIDLEGWGNDY